MNVDEIKTHIKRFFSNPNTLTFLLVMVSIVIVYFIYNSIVQKAISSVSIPYSTTLIKAKTEITQDMIGTVKISGSFISSSNQNLIQQRHEILGKYVAEGYQIAPNSFFYKETLANETDNDKTIFYDIPDDYSIFSLPVDFHSTYGCSIMPGNYIDLYIKQKKDNNTVVFEKFIKSIQVAMVVDGQGLDVFANTEDDQEPSPKSLYFIVPKDYKVLLEQLQLVQGKMNMELIPVPRNAGYSENPEETEIVNSAIEEEIKANTVYLEE